jgi:hypothetical protein
MGRQRICRSTGRRTMEASSSVRSARRWRGIGVSLARRSRTAGARFHLDGDRPGSASAGWEGYLDRRSARMHPASMARAMCRRAISRKRRPATRSQDGSVQDAKGLTVLIPHSCGSFQESGPEFRRRRDDGKRFESIEINCLQRRIGQWAFLQQRREVACEYDWGVREWQCR